MNVHNFQGVFYLLAIILLVVAALPINSGRVSLALLGAAAALTAYALPTLSGA